MPIRKTKYEGVTPGPWVMCDCGSCSLIWSIPMDGTVLRGMGRDEEDTHFPFGNLPDGRLAADAPELLARGEALVQAAEAVTGPLSDEDRMAAFRTLSMEVRAWNRLVLPWTAPLQGLHREVGPTTVLPEHAPILDLRTEKTVIEKMLKTAARAMKPGPKTKKHPGTPSDPRPKKGYTRKALILAILSEAPKQGLRVSEIIHEISKRSPEWGRSSTSKLISMALHADRRRKKPCTRIVSGGQRGFPARYALVK